ncbi:hypothetical protein [Amycolatopsis sp. DSM 110486]|uniref:hypothetical protein n=1 Tax=Amycolatopsis sp. DSM 110486 TaxID=2865832 RepID=UPI001C695CFF|nr:hypothetical protein [Amycolatopsis sp. DSM 110486]QYN26647.1 hypothetical protein K1T34_32930 [Amycolatopsis sp. DSM 110486]
MAGGRYDDEPQRWDPRSYRPDETVEIDLPNGYVARLTETVETVEVTAVAATDPQDRRVIAEQDLSELNDQTGPILEDTDDAGTFRGSLGASTVADDCETDTGHGGIAGRVPPSPPIGPIGDVDDDDEDDDDGCRPGWLARNWLWLLLLLLALLTGAWFALFGPGGACVVTAPPAPPQDTVILVPPDTGQPTTTIPETSSTAQVPAAPGDGTEDKQGVGGKDWQEAGGVAGGVSGGHHNAAPGNTGVATPGTKPTGGVTPTPPVPGSGPSTTSVPPSTTTGSVPPDRPAPGPGCGACHDTCVPCGQPAPNGDDGENRSLAWWLQILVALTGPVGGLIKIG